jgi:hypothetical protein
VSREDTLKTIKGKLKPEHIEGLWAAITNLDPSKLAIDPNRSRLEACQNWIASDLDLLQSIGQKALIKLGQENEPYARKVLIVLIRACNPEAFIGFNNKGLDAGSVEQTCESIVWPSIKKCKSLPIALIKALGMNPKIAKNILLDLEPHPESKELSDFFHTLHHWPRKSVLVNKLPPKKQAETEPPLLSFAYVKLKLKMLIDQVRWMIESIFNASPPNPILTWYDHYRATHRSQPSSELNARTIKRHR